MHMLQGYRTRNSGRRLWFLFRVPENSFESQKINYAPRPIVRALPATLLTTKEIEFTMLHAWERVHTVHAYVIAIRL